MKKLSILSFVLAAWPAQVGAFDSSDYRRNTYGSPTHYCDPARSLSDPGSGTLASPWNYLQCMSQPVAGNVVGHLPVGAGRTPVSLPPPPEWNVPAFQPANSGTALSRIVHVTQFAAVALDYSSITGNPNRTELRHSGADDSADVVRNGGSILGAVGRSHVVFDGFFIDMAQMGFRNDSGVITARSSTGVEFRNFVIKGKITDCDSNCVLYRPNDSRNTVLSNFRVRDFDNRPTGGGLNQQGLFSDQYGDQNYLIERFELDGTDNGIFAKGTANSATIFNYGTIRFGVIRRVNQCLRFNDFDPNYLTEVHNVLCHDYAESGVGLTSETSVPRNFSMHHVTIADGPTCFECNALTISQESLPMSNVTLRDNIFDYPGTNHTYAVWAWSWAHPWPASRHNGYYAGGNAPRWNYNGASYFSLSSWQAATGQEAGSLLLVSEPFSDRAIDDFRLRAGHAARTASSSGGELGAYAAAASIGVELGQLDLSSPAAPRGFGIR